MSQHSEDDETGDVSRHLDKRRIIDERHFNERHFDDSSNPVTSVSSVVSSPRTVSGWSQTPTLVDEISMEGGMLTEEAEEDLANNNDPNNNASNPEDDEIIQIGDRNSDFGQYFMGSEPPSPDFPEEDDRELEEDAKVIKKLLPQKSEDEIRNHLGAYIFHPKRLKVVLNCLLEEQLEEERQHKKDKAGNGLRCKNSKNSEAMVKKRSTPSEIPSTSTSSMSLSPPPGPSSGSRVSEIQDLAQRPSAKRKLPPPSCTVTSEEQERQQVQLGHMGQFQFKSFGRAAAAAIDDGAGPSNRATNGAGATNGASKATSILDLNIDERDLVGGMDAGAKRHRGASAATSSAEGGESSRPKIEIGETHLYGPFNFRAHRLDSQKTSRMQKSRKKFKVRDDLDFDDGDFPVQNVTPPLIDLGTASEGDATPPPLVDITQPEQHEVQELISSLCSMFPDTPRGFIEEQAEDLVGKPAALDRFINDHLNRDGAVPEDWTPRPKAPSRVAPIILDLDPGLPPPAFLEVEEDKAPDPEVEDHQEEDKNEKQLNHLLSVFPNADPEFLHQKVLEYQDKEEEMLRWIDETLENKANGLPTRKDYENRRKEAELLEKYSGQVSLTEILEMYDNDPESFFMDKSRTPSELYKRHASCQLKKEFRQISVQVINKVLNENSGLFLPSFRALQNYHGPKRKTKRPDHEAPMPKEIDINFLKELQYSRKEAEVRQHLADVESNRKKRLEDARKNNLLKECDCCSNEDCLEEDMLPCSGGHKYCRECIQRASAVAIGEGKTELKCLIHCEQPFSLSILRKALGANTFSKWLEKIQLAEIEKAGIDGLEQCPFCPFATIMDEPKEGNKVFSCLNPECGKESCRLCREISHIPLRCEEVEKDDEVRKRTYIENKMAEALIRTCYSCKRPYVKQDGCNKITCSNCGALMCYICRAPVKGYDHFAGQGREHEKDKCPLWSDNNTIHDRDVALGALEAKNEMEKVQPEVTLKHDPTAGINLEHAKAEKAKKSKAAQRPQPEFPPDLEGILPVDPFERERMIEEQRRIEQLILRGGDPGGLGAGPPHFMQFFPGPNHPHIHHDIGMFPNQPRPWNDNLLHRMGELLRLREDQRQRQRAIRRREQLALQEVRLHEIGLHGVQPGQAPATPPAAPPLPNPPQFGGQMFNQMQHPPGTNGHPHAGMIFPPPPALRLEPAHRQMPNRAVPPPPPAHHGMPRPAHAAPQPPALPLTFAMQQAGPMFHQPQRFQFEPIPLQRLQPGNPAPQPPQAARRHSPDLVQRELDLLLNDFLD